MLTLCDMVSNPVLAALVAFGIVVGAGCAAPPSDEDVGGSEGAASASAPDAGVVSDEAARRFRAAECTTCHAFERKLVGPSFRAVAEAYAKKSISREQKIDRLVKSVRSGSRLSWGILPMPENTRIDDDEARWLVAYILDYPNVAD